MKTRTKKKLFASVVVVMAATLVSALCVTSAFAHPVAEKKAGITVTIPAPAVTADANANDVTIAIDAAKSTTGVQINNIDKKEWRVNEGPAGAITKFHAGQEPYFTFEIKFTDNAKLATDRVTVVTQGQLKTSGAVTVEAKEGNKYKVTVKFAKLAKIKVDVPVAVPGLEYNGTLQTGVSFDEELVKVAPGSLVSAIDAGHYSAKFELLNTPGCQDYEWASAFNGRVDWEIAQKSDLAATKAAWDKIKNAKEAVVITSNGYLNDLQAIYVTGGDLKNFVLYSEETGITIEGVTLTEGSTVLTIPADIMAKFAVGNYAVKFVYNNDNYDPAEVETTLAVTEDKVAETGDTTVSLFVLFGIALAAVAAVAFARKGVKFNARKH